MRIKSFIAATVQEALKSVKREMGDASIILETRNIEEGDIKSRTGQTLVEVVAAESNSRQDESQDSEQEDGEDVQKSSDGSDSQSPDKGAPDTSLSDKQQSEQKSDVVGNMDVTEDYVDSVTLSDHLHSSKKVEPSGSTPTDQLSEISNRSKSGKAGKVTKWTAGSKFGKSLSHASNEIKNNGDNSKLLSSALNQTESSTSGWSPSKKYSSEKKQTTLTRSENDSAALSDHLLAEDLVEMAGYSVDERLAASDHQQDSSSGGDWPKASKELFNQLRLQQVEEEHTNLLINKVVSRLSNDEYNNMDLNVQMLREGIIQKIKITDSSFNNQNKSKIMVFVGAAGTGKTTTILKMASDKKKLSDKPILLISIRGHSAEKLKKTADRIGVTLRTVTSHRELKDIIEKYKSSSHIFIDTPGIGYRDENGLSGLKGFLDQVPNMETHLVVSAATRYADTINIINKFSLFPVQKLHFTKVDETCLYGTMLSVAMKTQIPLSCISDGQEVPEDLRQVTAEMVADMVLQG